MNFPGKLVNSLKLKNPPAFHAEGFLLSGWQDSNLRSPGPKPGALTNYTTPRKRCKYRGNLFFSKAITKNAVNYLCYQCRGFFCCPEPLVEVILDFVMYQSHGHLFLNCICLQMIFYAAQTHAQPYFYASENNYKKEVV